MKNLVMYLDVDDCLLEYRKEHHEKRYYNACKAAPFALEFLKWADKHFEIRWLTCWTLSGKLHETEIDTLNLLIPIGKEFLSSIVNPNSYSAQDKTLGIDFTDPRPWVWVEDDILPTEIELLKSIDKLDNYYLCNSSIEDGQLERVQKELIERFNLEG